MVFHQPPCVSYSTLLCAFQSEHCSGCRRCPDMFLHPSPAKRLKALYLMSPRRLTRLNRARRRAYYCTSLLLTCMNTPAQLTFHIISHICSVDHISSSLSHFGISSNAGVNATKNTNPSGISIYYKNHPCNTVCQNSISHRTKSSGIYCGLVLYTRHDDGCTTYRI